MRKSIAIGCIAASALILLLSAPFWGMESIPLDLNVLFNPGDIRAGIFWKIRVPRVLTAFLAGAGLSLSGMTFQALFRNPLATPFTLGVSSGAAFGTALVIHGSLFMGYLGFAGQSAGAFLGAAAAIGIVYGLTRVRHGFSTATMLLAGVAVNFFFSSFILFIQYVSDFSNTFRILRWLMGGLEGVGYRPVWSVLPFVAIGTVVVLFNLHELNLMTAGEDIAISRGVHTDRLKTVLFFAVSLMVGGIVAVAGPIGFVGMMSPHICRLVIGYDHRLLAPASFLFGGMFLVMCDTIARTVIAPVELPVGVITSLLGGPFFLWLLVGGRADRSLTG